MSLYLSLVWNGSIAFLCLFWHWLFFLIIWSFICLPITLYLELPAISSWLDSSYIFHSEYIDVVMSISGCHIWRHVGHVNFYPLASDVNFYHLVSMLSDVSTLELQFLSPATNYKKSVGKQFKIMQVSCSSSKFPPRFSLY